MYAIVDIETTGGYAANNAITEVAIVLHDGKNEVNRFESLVNPEMPIPQYVQSPHRHYRPDGFCRPRF